PKCHDKSAKEKSQTSGQNSGPSPFNHLGKLDGLVSPFESYRKKEAKTESGHEAGPFLPVSSAASVTNPLFTLASPLATFSPLLNPAALLSADPSKYSTNPADYCKLD